MKPIKKIFLCIPWLLVTASVQVCAISASRQTTIMSPDEKIRVTVKIDREVTFGVKYLDRPVVTVSNASMEFRDMDNSIKAPSLKTRSVDQVQEPLIREKRAVIADRFNELTVSSGSGRGLIIRVYNDGFAYRFFTRFKADSVIVVRETGSIVFSPGDSLYLPLIRCRDEKDVDCFHTSFEEDYVHLSPENASPGQLSYLPLYARTASGFSLAVTESDLHDYPGMFVGGGEKSTHSLVFQFPEFPLRVEVRGEVFRQELVTERSDYIACTSGERDYPWRVFIIGEKDRDLVNSDMVYRLASPCRIKDTDWIKPGKITDEWIINSIIYGVDFKSGINTPTYKYYVDFAHRFGFQYIFIDAGWSDVGDFSKLNPAVDIPGIVKYAREKQVGVWLWTSALTLKNNPDFLPRFVQWGIKGIMVDFMDREDQQMIRFQEKTVRETAENKLMLLFHGASKPSGLRKAYPNLISREGVMGHEFNKWTDRVTPEHDLIIPFTRMIAGPMDYEGGGMINAQKDAFRIVDPAPMTQGTRIHQLAMYVVYESPLQYMAGNISDYLKEPGYAEFLGRIPVEWDETLFLDGKISDYILVARRKGNDWWLGAMTDWTPRTLEADLSFLGEGQFEVEIYKDGINADRYAADFATEKKTLTSKDKIRIQMAPGGGFVAHFKGK